jgi:preprotein translocase subunit SecF
VRSGTLTEEEVTSFSNTIEGKNWGGSIEKVNTIGPTMGAEFTKNTFWAVLLAIIAIVLFVAYAFKSVPEGLSSWKFGLAAIVALTHDVLIIVGVFAVLGAILGIEIDTLFITALLSVLGFSVNDTIVIFDRVRENLKGQKNLRKFEQICESALWQSMRRSINTSVSTLIVLFTMLYFFLGFPELFAFFLALSIGFLVGTYSSIFLATPLLVSWQKK